MKIAKDFRRLNLEQLDKKEKELRMLIMKTENVYIGTGRTRMSRDAISKHKETFGTPDLKKLKKTLACLLTIKSQKEFNQ